MGFLARAASAWILLVLWLIIAKAVFDYWYQLAYAPFGSSLLIGTFHFSVLVALMWAIFHILFRAKF